METNRLPRMKTEIMTEELTKKITNKSNCESSPVEFLVMFFGGGH